MTAVADFTQSEIWAIETTPKERWSGQNIDLQLADVEIIAATVTSFHRVYQQYDTGKTEFNDQRLPGDTTPDTR